MATVAASVAVPVQGAVPLAPAAAMSRATMLSGWVAIIPYLVSIGVYFSLGDSPLRIGAPALPAIVVLLAAAALVTLRRAPVALNRDVALFLLAFVAINLASIAHSGVWDAFAIRKLLLPSVCILPAIFRYYMTPRDMALYLLALFLTALAFTLQSSDVQSGGFESTDSPFESILGIVFGALTVWLVANRRNVLAGFAFAVCVLFFKRNAIGTSAIVSALLLGAFFLSDRSRKRLFGIALLVVVPLLAIAAPFINDVFAFIVRSFTPGYDSAYVTVGRSGIWDAILRAFGQSTWAEKIFGNGAGAVETVIFRADPLHGGSPLSHNEYLSLLYDYGIAGLIVLLGLLLRVGRSGLPALAVLLFMAMSMVVENFFLISFVAIGVFLTFSTHLLVRTR